MKRLLLTAASLLLAAACAKATPTETGPTVRGIFADPARLAFLCVTPGCDDTQTAHVMVLGDRRVAIKRILLEGTGATDFEMTPTETPPFIVGGSTGFDIAVHYVPKGAPPPGQVAIRITYTDASPVESEDRLPPGELVIPLVRRVVGEPLLVATPDRLAFGVVKPGETKALPFHVANEGFGNMTLELASLDAGTASFQVTMPAEKAFGAGAGTDIPVTYAPTAEEYVKSELLITATAPEIVPAVVKLEATSLSTARIAMEPSGDLDFGEVPRKATRTLVANLVNQGGVPLNVSGITVTDTLNDLKVAAPNDQTSFTIQPLERVPLTILLDGQTAGELDATIAIASDDPQTPTLSIKVYGTVTEPQLTLTPGSLDYGTVPVGWVLTKSVELKNTGYGTLHVKNITMVAGSSNLFTLQNVPTLPFELKREQRAGLDVQFRAETAATFNAWLSVETDDPVNPFLELPIKAIAGSCLDSCPISHGTPSCSSGSCTVGSCNTGWYDTDKSAATGCECQEVGNDPGEFCQDSWNGGTLKDSDHKTVSFTGIIPVDGDKDVLRFFAEDAFQWFTDDFHVRIRLNTNDPTIKMCVYRHGGGHDANCYWTDEVCPQNNFYEKNNSGSGGDDADFLIKVYRTNGAANTCTGYTVFMSNG